MSDSFLALGTTHVGGDDNQVVGVEVHVVVVLAKQRQCGQVVNRDIEEALDLTLVQVEGDDAVDTGALEQVGDEAGGDGLARAGLAVLAGIARSGVITAVMERADARLAASVAMSSSMSMSLTLPPATD